MELHDGHVFIAKNDKGKDSTFLCSSAQFEVYKIGQAYKSPKGYNQVMMLKSRKCPPSSAAFIPADALAEDKSSMFENLADYMHVFACDDITGPQLFTALFCARVSGNPRSAHPLCANEVLRAPHFFPTSHYLASSAHLRNLCSRLTSGPLNARKLHSRAVFWVVPFDAISYRTHALHLPIVTSCPRCILMSPT